VSKYLEGTDPNELGKDSSFTDLAPFKYNIARATKGYATTFQSGDVQITINHKITESIPQNVNKTVSLKFPAAPPAEKWSDGARVPYTDAEREVARKEWAAGLRRIMHTYALPEPTDEQLENEILATGWLAGVEGAEVVAEVYQDKNGYGMVSASAVSSTKGDRVFPAHVAVSKVDDPAKDRKGIIPGVTRGEQARAKIAEAKGKV
jgi:hypothetical protein